MTAIHTLEELKGDLRLVDELVGGRSASHRFQVALHLAQNVKRSGDRSLG